jgi:ATPase family AAA domain-containing protein 3A/B
MPLQHAMFYGPPGTGKTMVAQRFAEYSGLEYAIMSGGDVAPLEEQAVTELHKLFKWVHRSKRGVLLFIDEADAFLTSRKNVMSESLRNALTTMLYHTGTPSSQFMLVIATNRPHDLDSAMLDRLDEAIEFGLPDLEARKGMVQLYYDKYIAKPLKLPMVSSGAPMLKKPQKPTSTLRSRLPGSPKPIIDLPKEEQVNEEAMGVVAERIAGFSGREISKLFTSLQTHVLYQSVRQHGIVCSRTMLYEVVSQKVAEHSRTSDFQVTGYEYSHSEPNPDEPEHTNGGDKKTVRKLSPKGVPPPIPRHNGTA